MALVRDWGYPGIFAMMAVESSFVPFPSEVALIPAGYLVSQGEMNALLATAAGLGGSLLGAFVNYGLAVWVGRPFVRFVERVPGARDALGRSERYFLSHGEITTFVGRLIPGIRQLISIPAGLARMSLVRFGAFTALGAGLWSAVLVTIGYLAGQSEELWRPLLREATIWIVGGAIVLVGGYVYLHRRASRKG